MNTSRRELCVKETQKRSFLKRLTILICSCLVSVGIYSVSVYFSLDNVFLEMNYGAMTRGSNLFNLPAINGALDSNVGVREPEWIRFVPLNKTNLDINEQISVIVGRYQVFGLEFRKELEENIFLYITFTLKSGKLIEEIEISNSDTSLSHALQGYYVDKKEDRETNKQESLESTYWFSSSKGLPSLQITDTKEVLEYLKPYGIDEKWIQAKADYMLYDVVLKRWFENGSQRYSFDNLGDVEIVQLDFGE